MLASRILLGGNRRRVTSVFQSGPLQNLDFLVYGEQLAEDYAIGDPMPTIGVPSATAFDASREGQLLSTAGGSPYIRTDSDGYGTAPGAVPENPTSFTAIIIGRNWDVSFWSIFGRTNIVSGSVVDSWTILFNSPNLTFRTTNPSGVDSVVSVTQPLNSFWFAALRVSDGRKVIRLNNTIVSDVAYSEVRPTNDVLRFMTRRNGSGTSFFGRGDTYLAAYANRAVSDADLNAIYAMRPTS